MKLLLVGANGVIGQLVTEEALRRGHQVTAYVRRPKAVQTRAGLSVVTGQLNDIAKLQSEMNRADAVIVTLGTHETKKVTLMQDNLPFIVKAMQGSQTKRLILLSAYGIGDTASTASFVAKIAYKTVVKSVFEDKAQSETVLPKSGLQWTGVYPVIFADGELSPDIVSRPLSEVKKVKGLPKIPRKNVAKAIVDAAEQQNAPAGLRLVVAPQGSLV